MTSTFACWCRRAVVAVKPHDCVNGIATFDVDGNVCCSHLEGECIDRVGAFDSGLAAHEARRAEKFLRG